MHEYSSKVEFVQSIFVQSYLRGHLDIKVPGNASVTGDKVVIKGDEFVVTITASGKVGIDIKVGKSEISEQLEPRLPSKFPIKLAEDEEKKYRESMESQFEEYFDHFFKLHRPKQSSASIQHESTTLREGTGSVNVPLSSIKQLPGRDSLRIPIVSEPKPVPSNMAPPGFDDELEIEKGRQGSRIIPGFGNDQSQGSYGDSDRFPNGERVPNLDPSGPHAIGSGRGGMIPTADDPLFRPEERGRNGNGNLGGIRYDDPVAGPNDDLSLVGEGLPGDMGVGREHGRRGRNSGIGGNFNGNFKGHFGSQFGGNSGGFGGFGGFI